MPRTHDANKSTLFSQIFGLYEVTQREFAQINYPLFERFSDGYEVKLLGFAQINCTLFAHVYAA